MLSGVTFDLAWLFGDAESPVSTLTGPTRQVIEFDKVVASAMVAW